MVNKQYNVQGLNKKLKQQNTTTPPPSTPTTTSTHVHLSNTNDNAFHNDDFDVIDHSDDNTSKVGSSLSSNGHHKDLSINDIGRFQYILQMDRELVSVCVTVFGAAILSSRNGPKLHWPNFYFAIMHRTSNMDSERVSARDRTAHKIRIGSGNNFESIKIAHCVQRAPSTLV